MQSLAAMLDVVRCAVVCQRGNDEAHMSEGKSSACVDACARDAMTSTCCFMAGVLLTWE